MANHIHNIEIKNFKSIRHQKIEDCRRVNVFIGYPNTGKSNILEALSLFSINESAHDFSLIRIGTLPTLFFNGNIEEPFSITLNKRQQRGGFYQNDALKVFRNHANSEGNLEEVLKHNLEEKKYFEINSKKEIEFKKIKYYESKYFQNILKYEFLKNTEYKEGTSDFLYMPNGSNIFSVIYSNQKIRNEIRELFYDYGLELLYDFGTRTYSIQKNVQDGVFSIPYSMIADTLQRLIFYKTAILSNRQSVLLFEEPEAHMFPPYVSKFTADVMYDENENQYFITTHSPFVLNDFMENLKYDELSIYAVGYKKQTGETEIRKLSESELDEIYQYGIDLFFNLEKYLEID